MLVDIPAALSGHGLGSATSIAILEQRPGRLVARVDTDTGPVVVKASSEAGAFAPEVAAVGRLAAAGLPVARVLGHGVGPPAYVVLSWIDGGPLTAASRPSAQREAGALLRRIHASWPGPGDVGPQPWDEWMAGWLNNALALWSTVDNQVAPRAIWAWYHELAPLLATRGRQLILFDGRPEHIIVRGHAVAGLIDVSELRAGDAAMDLGVLAVSEPDLLPGVLAGYRPDAEERAVFDRLIPFYVLLRRISRVEWMQRHGTAEEVEAAVHLLTTTEVPR